MANKKKKEREGNGTPLQYSCLENPMDREAWWAAVYGVAQSRTWLKQLSSSSSNIRMSVFTFTFHFHALEKEMATHSSVLTWRIPGMGEPFGLPYMGSHRVGHDWSNLAAGCLFILFMVFFALQKFVSLIRSHLFIFVFISTALGEWPKKTLVWYMSENVVLMISSRSFMVSQSFCAGKVGQP